MCALSTRGDPAFERDDFLRTSARLLICVVFFFAALWKVVGGQYADGSFMEFTLLTDARFAQLATTLTGATLVDLAVTREAVSYVARNGLVGVVVELPSSPAVRSVALALSWTGVTLEGGIAVLHALPGTRAYILRHVSLFGFVAVTYFLFPVPGFAWILAVLGYAGCRAHDETLRVGYFALLGVIFATELPWQRLIQLLP